MHRILLFTDNRIYIIVWRRKPFFEFRKQNENWKKNKVDLGQLAIEELTLSNIHSSARIVLHSVRYCTKTMHKLD